MATIALDRQFWEWSGTAPPDPDIFAHLSRPTGLLSWADISARRRVILLAEAGSGKTEEMREQTRLRVAHGQFAFFASVEDVGNDGLEAALRTVERSLLAAWRASDQNAWFFIDSIDEAKLGRVRMDRALRKIADAISGEERRAYIVLSCRLLDWEFASDLKRLTDELPILPDPNLPPPLSTDEVLVRALRQEKPKEQEHEGEQPLVVLMLGLDAGRVRRFAAGKGVLDIARFLDEIQSASLWRFVRRPLDLDWLVEFWKDRGSVGSLAQMLECSLAARVAETNNNRARDDTLDAVRASYAIERIGAALVFSRRATIAIPDSDFLRPEDDGPLIVDEVIPDLSARDRSHLLSRPVFDPATFGRARLHNDNDGAVRGYLAARWLQRLSTKNLSRGDLFNLIFATSYDIELLKPSARETAAWLALWNDDIGREVARREPALLLSAGDPASLSLSVRGAVLTHIVEKLEAGGCPPTLDFGGLKRFSRPDLSAAISRLWTKYESCSEVREFLLRLVWLGPVPECARLAERAIHTYSERTTQIAAARAITAAGDASMTARHADFVKAHYRTLPATVTIDAIDSLFPTLISVADLINIIARMEVVDADGGLRIEWYFPGWIDRIPDRIALEQFLRGMLDGLGPEGRETAQPLDKRREVYLVAVAASACRLLERFYRPDEASVVTIEAAIRIRTEIVYSPHSTAELKDVGAELRRTGVRRRLALWGIAKLLDQYHWLRGRPAENLAQIESIGFPLDLQLEDADWLLMDASDRPASNERRLALNASLRVCRDMGSPPDLLARIERVAQSDSLLLEHYRAWFEPRPVSAEEGAMERQRKKLRERGAADQAMREASWIEFSRRLQSNPDQLRHLPRPGTDGVDARLFHLWEFLSADIGSWFAIDTVRPLERMFGAEVAAAARDAFIGHWRLLRPRLKSQRRGKEVNQVRTVDIMGLAGVSLEAAGNPQWAAALTNDEAIRAAEYATLEINGFPSWLAGLAAAKPGQVRKVLQEEIAAELGDPKPRIKYDTLEHIARDSTPVVALMAPVLMSALRQRTAVAAGPLALLLAAIVKGIGANRAEFVALMLDRSTATEDIEACGLFLSATFAVDPPVATDALRRRLDDLDERAQAELVQQILPNIFGTGFYGPKFEPPPLDFGTLERLVGIAFRTLRVDEDQLHPNLQVFTPSRRDDAQDARGKAFERLINTPGRATFAAILRLTESPECPISKQRLLEFARDRAARDSECAPWAAGDALAFETDSEAVPSTAKDLQTTALRRLDDMQYDLLQGDFSQATTLRAQPTERAVQNWIADRLRLKQGQAYSIEREPHVADEKEPDIRLQGKVPDVSTPIEIKVAESCSICELEAALSTQLCGQYLRARGARHGILLLVHKVSRPKGWKAPNGDGFWSFTAVTAHLRRLAAAIASQAPDSPQPEIAVLDVSTFRGRA